MRFLLAIAMFVTLLAASTSAHADSTEDAPVEGASPRRIEPTGRCLEQPMSLAIAIAEYEASRALSPRSLVSPGEPVVATPRPVPPAAAAPAPTEAAPRPFTPSPRACTSPDDPGCRLGAPLTPPARIHLDQADHGCAPVGALASVPPVYLLTTLCDQPGALGAPLDGHPRSPWRPPLG